MTELDKKIVELIKQNMCMGSISALLNISEKQLFIRLKKIINYGYQIFPTYSGNSDIYYNMSYSPKNEKKEIDITISKSLLTFKCLVISDLHVGNYKSDISLVNYVYDYAAKNDINYIFVCGDCIEGDYTTDRKNISDVDRQVEELIKKYPYDKNINSVMIFGNHDYHSLKSDGLDLSERIKNSRYDMIPLGYGCGYVRLKKDGFIMFHKLHEASSPTISNDERLVLSGHGHMMKAKIRDQFWLCIPTLSHIPVDRTKEVIPGFVELSIDFEKGKFEYVSAKHMIITPKVVAVSEAKCKIKSLIKSEGI